MLVCRETDSLGCVNCVEKGWNKMENKVTVVLADANEEFRTMLRQRMEGTVDFIDYFMNNIEKNRIEEYGQNII